MTSQSFGLPAAALERAFPFHMVIRRDGTLLGLGPALRRICPGVCAGDRIDQQIEFVRPLRAALDWRLFAHRPDSLFLIRVTGYGLRLRGQMLPIEGQDHVVFLGSPEIGDAAEAERLGIVAGDFAVGDPVPERVALMRSAG